MSVYSHPLVPTRVGRDGAVHSVPARQWPLDAIFAHCTPEPNSGCWLWTESVNHHGYAARDAERMHRVAYERVFGPIPQGLFACHRCDQRSCVNPAHVFLGTAADNNADMKRKGRARSDPHTKLTPEQVIELRAAWQSGVTRKELAARFGVALGSITGLVRGTNWRHLPGAVSDDGRVRAGERRRRPRPPPTPPASRRGRPQPGFWQRHPGVLPPPKETP